MFFLVAFAWHVAASFAFLLAILSPKWLSVQTVPALGNIPIERGIFYVCDVLSKNSTYQTSRCASIIALDPSTNSSGRWHYSESPSNKFTCNYYCTFLPRSCDFVGSDCYRLCWTQCYCLMVSGDLF